MKPSLESGHCVATRSFIRKTISIRAEWFHYLRRYLLNTRVYNSPRYATPQKLGFNEFFTYMQINYILLYICRILYIKVGFFVSLKVEISRTHTPIHALSARSTH